MTNEKTTAFLTDSWKNQNLGELPRQEWGKKLEYDGEHTFTGDDGETLTARLRIYSVEPQARLIGVTVPVGTLAGFSPDAILVKAFEKNYKTPSKPGVVEKYGFEQKHGEPLELVGFQFENIYDRACEAEMNRYRHNSKNYESGRYVDYILHGLTIVFPEDAVSEEERQHFIRQTVLPDLIEYARLVKIKKLKKQAARRRLGFYVAVESVFSINLRSLCHMAAQRSAKYSPNGKEAEPQISKVVTDMIESIEPYLPRFFETMLAEIGKGYR